MKTAVLAGCLALCLAGCASAPRETSFVGVMVDNHQTARAYQRGLDDAAFVVEHFAEGFITRFEAVYDVARFPASVGPVRSVRPYYVTGGSPVVSAVFHVGGSPEALALLEDDDPVSFNALHGFDAFFDYDDIAPAPHHRFLPREGFAELFARVPSPAKTPFPFPFGSFEPEEDATAIAIDMHSEVHDVSYSYEPGTKTYIRRNRGARQASTPANLVVIETDVAVTGELGRLTIRTDGSGPALLFRDGGVAHGEWSKEDGAFYAFTDADGEPLRFRDGQVWMLVVDDLARVSW